MSTTTPMDRLSFLSREAHFAALKRGDLTPAERPEFFHLPMLVDPDGVAVFDGHRMRDDWIDETCTALEAMVTRKKPVDSVEAVTEYMRSSGLRGVRRQDVARDTNVPDTTVRRILARLEEEGTIVFREERTRGAKGSRRKRYYWSAASPLVLGSEMDDAQADAEDYLLFGQLSDAGTGIVHHGTPTFSVVCPCARCSRAAEEWIVGEMTTSARRSGGNQIEPGAWMVTRRREFQERRDREALVAAGQEDQLWP